jgi:hypothetical protein
MIRQRVERSVVQKLHDAVTTCQFAWLSNERSRVMRGEITQTQSDGMR